MLLVLMQQPATLIFIVFLLATGKSSGKSRYYRFEHFYIGPTVNDRNNRTLSHFLQKFSVDHNVLACLSDIMIY